MTTLSAFDRQQKELAKRLLATTVASMMGRKFEEGDWASVYCVAKNIPQQGWSNLHIDVMHEGLGVEHKMLCVKAGKTLMDIAGTSQMHPSATRSIRIDSTEVSPQDAMVSVFSQYRALIDQRAARVASAAPGRPLDMRVGWLLWERSLTEFMYFEEPMFAPNPDDYWAEWNEREVSGARKASKNLWIYEHATNKKRYSVTTSAGIKIQPYFDVPAPNDPNLNYFRVQSEPLGSSLVRIWISADTARKLRVILHDEALGTLSEKILELSRLDVGGAVQLEEACGLAVPVEIQQDAHEALVSHWVGVSDEHRVQLFLQSLQA